MPVLALDQQAEVRSYIKVVYFGALDEMNSK